jgi:hypothetical protein
MSSSNRWLRGLGVPSADSSWGWVRILGLQSWYHILGSTISLLRSFPGLTGCPDRILEGSGRLLEHALDSYHIGLCLGPVVPMACQFLLAVENLCHIIQRSDVALHALSQRDVFLSLPTTRGEPLFGHDAAQLHQPETTRKQGICSRQSCERGLWFVM